ncbi:MAG: O-antigen ligase family protein [Verrucomicrobiota bacterium]|jgi:hypothetical protein
MNNVPAVLRSLITFALIVPLAVFVGYMLTKPLSFSTLAIFGVLLLALLSPLLMRWHYPLMLLCWNMSAIAFFVQGAPAFSLVMIALSLGISVLERMLRLEKQFIRVPQITWPLLFLVGVVLFTAKMTGGFGLRAFGSEVYGGKKYVFLIVGILGYFALTARRISPQQVGLYVALFLLGGVTSFIGDLYPIIPSGLHFIFWIFPPQRYEGEFVIGTTRLFGVSIAAGAFFYYMMARFGIRGIFMGGKPWRLVATVLFLMVSCLGGFRGGLLGAMLFFLIQFFLEGLHRTKLLPMLATIGALLVVLLIPLAPKLPFTFQRSLSFLPLPLDPATKMLAAESSEWRIEMWKALLPQIPQHLLVGKGYAISMEDYQMMSYGSAFKAVDPSQQGLALAGDYHNGPLSVILPFGIWGVIAFVWFLAAGSRVVYRNYRYSDPSLQIINTFLLASFIVQVVFFLFIFGAFNGDMAKFVSTLGLSVALNGGVCHPLGTMPPKPQTNSQ